MTYLLAVPVLERPEACPAVETWDAPGVLVIDHTPDLAWADLCAAHFWRHIPIGRNLGVAGGWNIAREIALDRERHTYTLFFSASVTWYRGLRETAATMVDTANRWGCLSTLAWHAIMLSNDTLRECGSFDENLWPGYHSDTDYGRRMELLGLHSAAAPIPKLEVAAECPDAKTYKSGLVGRVDWSGLQEYMIAKWGDVGGAGHLKTPFGLEVPVSWWSPHYQPGLA